MYFTNSKKAVRHQFFLLHCDVLYVRSKLLSVYHRMFIIVANATCKVSCQMTGIKNRASCKKS